MNTELEPDDDERALQALFDQTAQPPDTATLQRIARKAAQIPSARPWYQPVWLRGPWGAVAVSAAAALALVVGLLSLRDGDRHRPIATTTAPLAGSAPSSSPQGDELDALLAFDLTESTEPDDALEPLDIDPLAAWVDDDAALLASDEPVDLGALDLLFVDAFADSELLGGAFDDVLAEGG